MLGARMSGPRGGPWPAAGPGGDRAAAGHRRRQHLHPARRGEDTGNKHTGPEPDGELAALRLRRLAEEHCLQSSVAQADRQPPLESHAFIRRVASAGFRLSTFMAVHKYLERCRANNSLPDREHLVRALIPWSRDYPAPRLC